jgi:uncharacterized membrane protein
MASDAPQKDTPPDPPPADDGALRLGGRDFATAMVHLYRGEVTRANAWRTRIDVTTNWSLVATGTALTFAFGNADAHHSVILLVMILVTLFLFIEARSYRYFDLWNYRTRLIERNFYGAALARAPVPDMDWQSRLGESLLEPHFTVSWMEAVGRRVRRTYFWIYLVLHVAWIAKLILISGAYLGPTELAQRARMGVIPGWAVFGAVALADLLLLLAAGYSLRVTTASSDADEYQPRR